MTELSDDSLISGSPRHALLPGVKRAGSLPKHQVTAFFASVSQETNLHLDRVPLVFG
jgi:hypothetical protein